MDADDHEASPDGVRPPRVVVGVDGSAHSDRALAWAAAEARLRGATLEIVHAMFYRTALLELFPEELDRERSILDHAVAHAAALEPTLEVSGVLAEPPPSKALIDASQGADLLVVGSRGFGGFKELEMGSVSHQCAQHAHCCVVIVRPPDPIS